MFSNPNLYKVNFIMDSHNYTEDRAKKYPNIDKRSAREIWIQ